jgi:hypothetical protein
MNQNKKQENSDEIVLDLQDLELIDSNTEKPKKTKKNTVRIQPLEEYLSSIGITDVSKLSNPAEYAEINVDRKCKQDDVLSITPGLQSPPYTRLYASLLAIKYEQDIKKLKEEYLKPFENLNLKRTTKIFKKAK